MSSFAQNRDWADKALKHTQKIMTIGSYNTFGALYTPRGWKALSCVNKMREEIVPMLAMTDGSMGEQLRVRAEVAGDRRCGNCAEQAAVAFAYLVGIGARPIEYFDFSNKDHAYVVIGRPLCSEITIPETWGPYTFICDPWRGAVYHAVFDKHIWATKMEPWLIGRDRVAIPRLRHSVR